MMNQKSVEKGSIQSNNHRSYKNSVSMIIKKNNLVVTIFDYMIITFVIVICVLPFIWVLLSSFKTNAEVLQSAFTFPSSFSFASYKKAIEITGFYTKFMNSMLISISVTIGSILIYALAAYAIARFDFRGKKLIFGILISSILIPTNTMVQPVYTIIKFLGLYDTKLALIITYTGFSLPMCLFLMRSFFSSLPKEMEESAYLDGAGFFSTFWKIMLPLSKPVIVSASVLTFLGAWCEFLYALLLTSSVNNRTLPLSMSYFLSMFHSDYPPMFAALVMYIIPTIFIYVMLQEQIMTSMVTGAVKA